MWHTEFPASSLVRSALGRLYTAWCAARPRGAALALALLLGATLAHADEVLDQARRLLDGGDAAGAFALLEPLEGERAGEEAFDFLFGVAALESGRPSVAVFALERVVSVNPEHVAAHAQLGRAYFEIRDNVLAKREFERVQGMSPPDSVRRAVERYLGVLDDRFESLRPTRVRLHYEMGGGYDSNANSATDDRAVAIPLLGNVIGILSPTGVETDSVFLTGQLGANASHRLHPDLHLLAGAQIDLREYTADRADTFSQGTYDGYVGLGYSRGRNTYSLALRSQWFNVNSHLFRDIIGVAAQMVREVDSRNRLSLFGHVYGIDYHPAAQTVRDVDQLVLGAGWVHEMQREGMPVLFGQIYWGKDYEEERAGRHFGRTFIGLRAGGQYTLRPDLDLVGHVAMEDSNYGGQDPLFLVNRDDTYFEVSAGLRYRPYKHWTIKPEVRFSRNESNIPITDFTRFVGWVTARYDFR